MDFKNSFRLGIVDSNIELLGGKKERTNTVRSRPTMYTRSIGSDSGSNLRRLA